MFDECRDMWVLHMASRCGIDLEQQVLLGSINTHDLQIAAQKCWSCSKSGRCEGVLNASTPLLQVPKYCVNSDFLKQMEQMNTTFWCGIEFVSSNDSAFFVSELTQTRIFGVDTCIELEDDGLQLESWSYLEEQSRSWEWRYTCEEWLLENTDTSFQVDSSDSAPDNSTDAGRELDVILHNAELGYWLVRNVAKKIGVNLSGAMEDGDFTQSQYANMVLECCLCPLRDQCQNWLDEAQVSADTFPSGCSNAAAFGRLLTCRASTQQ